MGKEILTYKYICQSISTCEPYEVYLVPGFYLFEAWGAQGGADKGKPEGGKGGYTSGYLKLHKSSLFYIYVGSHGSSYPNEDEYAYNGGGKAKTSGGGGGATDFRLIKGETYKEKNSLQSRILVAGGGGGSDRYDSTIFYGGAGGGLIAQGGTNGGSGGTQNEGGRGGLSPGELGVGGSVTSDACGGGGGYYGGASGKAEYYGTAGGGGSSYISGHPNCSDHYSLLKFTNVQIISGTDEEYGKIGHGEARITILNIYQYQTCKRKFYNLFYLSCLTNLILYIK